MQGIILREMIPCLLFWSASLALPIFSLHQKVIPFLHAQGREAKGSLGSCDWGRVLRRMLAAEPRSVGKCTSNSSGEKRLMFPFWSFVISNRPSFLPHQCRFAFWRTATKPFPLFLSSSVVCFNGLIDPRRSKWTVYFLLSIVYFWFLRGITELLMANVYLGAVFAFVCHTFCSASCGSFANFDRCKICGAFLWWQTVRGRKCSKYIF